MRISLRLTMVLLIAAVVPLLMAGIWSLYTLRQASELATQESQAALEELGEAAILQTARSVASQVKLYLDTHPEVDLSDHARLQSNAELAAIAVQPVGQTGYTAVFDQEAITHFHENSEIVGTDMSTLAGSLPEFWAIFEAALDGSLADGYYDWEDADGEIRPKYMSIVPVEGTPLRLAATTYIDEFSGPVAQTSASLAEVQARTRIQLIVALIVVMALSVGAALLLGRWLSQPIMQMADAANRIATGDLSPVNIEAGGDEVGTLAATFNAMTTRIRELLAGLEARDQELARRTRHLQEVTEIAGEVTARRNLDEVLGHAVELIRSRFGFSQVKVYLSGEGQQADGSPPVELRAFSGEHGRTLALGEGEEEERRLVIEEGSLVGQVMASGRPQVARVTASEAASEGDWGSQAVLPLLVGGRVVGALEVQSQDRTLLGEEQVVLFQVLADQLAVAIENASLLQQMEQTVRELEVAYGRYTQEAWQALILERDQARGYRYRDQTVEPVAEWPAAAHQAWREGQPVIAAPATDEESRTGGDLAVPIRLRDQVVGVFNLRFQGETVGPETISLVGEVASRLSLALESASLQQDAQRRAAREQLTGEVAARIRATLDVDSVLQTAVREIGEALGVPEVEVRMARGTAVEPAVSAMGDNGGKEGEDTAS